MLRRIDDLLSRWRLQTPWTNVYGMARSLIAFASMLTLIINKPEIIFKPSSVSDDFPICEYGFSAFCFAQNDYTYLNLIRWIFIFILFLVVIGWRPRFTGVFHWYVAYSMQSAMVVIDGGEQVASVITFLLIPVTLTDHRKWHWGKPEKTLLVNIYSKIIANISFFIIRIQVAIIYFHSVVAKLVNAEWVDGTAVYYYTREKTIGFNLFFDKITASIVGSPLIVIPTWGTLLVQLLIFGGLFAPKKYWKTIFLVAILMHEVFALMLGLISFSIIMIGALMLYLIPIESELRRPFQRKQRMKDGTENLKEVI